MRVKSIVQHYEDKGKAKKKEKGRAFPKGTARGMGESSTEVDSSDKGDATQSSSVARDTLQDVSPVQVHTNALAEARTISNSSPLPFIGHAPRIHVTPPTIKQEAEQGAIRPRTPLATNSRRPSITTDTLYSPKTSTINPHDSSITNNEDPTMSSPTTAAVVSGSLPTDTGGPQLPSPPQTLPSEATTHTTYTTEAPVTHEVERPQIEHVTDHPITREIHEHSILHRIQPVVDVELLPARHFVVVDNRDEIGEGKKDKESHNDSQKGERHIEIKGEGSRRQSLRNAQPPELTRQSGDAYNQEGEARYILREILPDELAKHVDSIVPREGSAETQAQNLNQVRPEQLPRLSDLEDQIHHRLREALAEHTPPHPGSDGQAQQHIPPQQAPAEQQVEHLGDKPQSQDSIRLKEVSPEELPGRLGTEGEVNELFARGREEALTSAKGKELLRGIEKGQT